MTKKIILVQSNPISAGLITEIINKIIRESPLIIFDNEEKPVTLRNVQKLEEKMKEKDKVILPNMNKLDKEVKHLLDNRTEGEVQVDVDFKSQLSTTQSDGLKWRLAKAWLTSLSVSNTTLREIA